MRVHLTPGTTLTAVQGKSVLFSVKTGISYGLNETAGEMLRLGIDQGLDAATHQLSRDYEAPIEEIRSDLDELVGELVRLKFVQLAAAQGS